ncbi:MAG: MATE family efflux transporter [Deltaproteobacteria bacterium]|nr:MATE family efflux transporter [Deltaproteobacteria bacterium]
MRDRVRQVLVIALPIIGGMTSQNILNLVDTGMVGTLGDEALAAVGTGSFANFLAMAFITGLSAGVQAIAARRKGEGRDTETAIALNGALLTAIVLGIPLSIALWFTVPYVFPLLNPDPVVVEMGIPYLQIRVLAMVAVGMNFAFRGYWNGVNLSKLYLRTLLVMHAANIFLNWVLIFGNLGAPAMGATGAAIGSAVATAIGTIYYVMLGLRYARAAGFLRRLPDAEGFRIIGRLALPNAFQQLFFAAGFNVLFWIIAHSNIAAQSVATAELAAANVVLNVTLVAVLPGLGLGLAAASLVGQALGRCDPNDALNWGWDVVKIAAVVMGVLGLPMLLFPDAILGVFLRDPATVEIARAPLRLVGATIAVDAIGMVLMNALVGAGASRTSMVVSVSTQWLLFLPVAYVLGPVLGLGLLPIWIANVSYRGLTAVIFAYLWRQGRWADIEV